MGILKDIVGGLQSAWVWFKCRALGVHSPSRVYTGTCLCQQRRAL